MSLILSIDTSARGCSVALHQNQQLLACYELLADKSSSGRLTTLIENIVSHNEFTLEQLDAIAVAKGPGSYTGLRIAVSTAKGLCFALEKPLIAIHTLQAMVKQVADYYEPTTLLCPMLDARRMEVFCAVYDKTLYEIQPVQAKIIDAYSFAEILSNHKMVFFGDGAAKCKALLEYQANAIFIDHPIYPSAKTVGELAHLKFKNNDFEDTVSFEPFYLKEFVGTIPKSK